MKKQRKQQRIFLELRVLFSNMGTLKSMHRRSVLSTFHDSPFFEFRKKMIQKTWQNKCSKKTSKNEAQGTQK